MRRGLLVVVTVVALALLATIAFLLQRGEERYSFVVTGDLPYTEAQQAELPGVVAQINAEPDVRLVVHLGDIKAASSACSDTYFRSIDDAFAEFEDPLVYTPGDNEWTDCHRPEAGAYNPLERLEALRTVFFERSNEALGEWADDVASQRGRGMPENVRWRKAGVSFAAVHVVGGNNGVGAWTGESRPTPEQMADVLRRTAGAVEEIHDVFAAARQHGDRSVVLFMQADPFPAGSSFADLYTFQPVVEAIAREAVTFAGPVYLFNGDSHAYLEDRPLDRGSAWLEVYGLDEAIPNLTRVTIDGGHHASGYLVVTPGAGEAEDEVLTWRTVPFESSLGSTSSP